MAAKLEKTRTPGIYKRGNRYVFPYRVNGKQRWESCRMLDEARRKKAARMTDIERGEFEERSKITLHEYAREWVKRHRGRGRRGFRENTRDEYERLLERYVLKYFPERTRLTDITPLKIAEFVSWLCEQTRPAPTMQDKKRRVPIADKTVRNIVTPLRACLATAAREGLIRSNPARDVDLPDRHDGEEPEDHEVKAMSREELAILLAAFPQSWHPFFWFLSVTGVRISEAIALQWRHIDLDEAGPHVKVRRALVKGRLGPPKSRYGRRDIPLDDSITTALREHRNASEWSGEQHPVFPAGNGSPLMPGNVSRRVLEPARNKAGLEWVGFHAFRHTCATMLFAEGRNAVQVQRWLGHHSAAFTLATYVHLLDGDLGAPLTLTSRDDV